MIPRAEIGVFGGSGFYDLIENVKEFEIETPFGKTSDKINIGSINKKRVAFIPRHGKGHKLPPHKIPYQANLWAMKKIGVKKIISPIAVGSLNYFIKPGDFVICDQFINWTKHRKNTFYNGNEIENIKKSDKVAHFSMAEPYCNELRKIAIKSAKKINIKFHETGTVVVIEGPQFSTRAESKFFSAQNWDIINMTAYPEIALARELGICYINIGLVTDYDAGLVGNKNIKPVTVKEVIKIFNQNNIKVKNLIFEIIGNIPKIKKCKCDKYLDDAVI
ncbi:MAG: S-methyl-5'-thioadenosine phosphorylase [Patescibacteria group bacterium]